MRKVNVVLVWQVGGQGVVFELGRLGEVVLIRSGIDGEDLKQGGYSVNREEGNGIGFIDICQNFTNGMSRVIKEGEVKDYFKNFGLSNWM